MYLGGPCHRDIYTLKNLPCRAAGNCIPHIPHHPAPRSNIVSKRVFPNKTFAHWKIVSCAPLSDICYVQQAQMDIANASCQTHLSMHLHVYTEDNVAYTCQT